MLHSAVVHDVDNIAQHLPSTQSRMRGQSDVLQPCMISECRGNFMMHMLDPVTKLLKAPITGCLQQGFLSAMSATDISHAKLSGIAALIETWVCMFAGTASGCNPEVPGPD